MEKPTSKGWKEGFIEANGIRFHYAEQGKGPLVLLLHSLTFPETPKLHIFKNSYREK